MNKTIRIAAVVTLLATAVLAQDPLVVHRVSRDAMAIDRVAEAAKKDLPVELLKRIVNEDIDLLRGKRPDGGYQYATWERLEGGRTDRQISVNPRKDDALEAFEMRGAWVYRLLVSAPARRLYVTKNRPVYVDRVEMDFIPEAGSSTQTHVVKVESWMAPGEVRPIDFPVVAKQGGVRVYAKADKEKGYGNITLSLVQAKIIDNADSPYADTVASAKAMLRAIEANEIPSIRSMATRIQDTLGNPIAPLAAVVHTTPAPTPAPAVSNVTVTAPASTTANADLYRDLQEIEDLLTGSEAERRQGLDKLHQLTRKYRP